MSYASFNLQILSMKRYTTALLLSFISTVSSFAFWPTSSGPEDGWKSLSWLGDFYSQSYDEGWFYHEQHAWLYANGDSPSMFFVYMSDRLNWAWLSEGAYPWLYDFEHDNWIYYNRDSDYPRWFYNNTLKRWETAPLEQLTLTSLAEMQQRSVSDIQELPPVDFQKVTDDEDDASTIPFEARLGFISDGDLYSETANIYAGDATTAMLQLSLNNGVFDSSDRVSFAIIFAPRSDYREYYWLTYQGEQLTLHKTEDLSSPIPFKPLETGSSTLLWQLFETGFFAPGEYIFRIYVDTDGERYKSSYETLVILSPEVSEDPANIIADTGFRPAPNGFGFGNFTSARDSDLTNEEIVSILGADEALYPSSDDASELRPIARLWREFALDGVRGGHCLGMAGGSMLMFMGVPFEGKVTPADFQAGAASTLEIQRAYTRNLITYYATMQFSGNFLEKTMGVERTPKEVLQATIDAMHTQEPIYFLGITEYDGGGGHAITPYLVTDEGDGLYRIYVYDNNFPADSGRFIEVDTIADTWDYGLTQPTPGGFHLEYKGDAISRNLSIATYSVLQEFDRGVGVADEVVVSASDPAQLSFEIDGQLLGYDFETGDFVDHTPSGEITPTLDVNAPPSYRIAASANSDDPQAILNSMIPVTVGIPAQDIGGAIPDEVDEPIDLNVMGASAGFEMIDLGIGPGEYVYAGIHTSGAAVALQADALPFAPRAVVLYQDKGEFGYIYEITNLQLEPEEGILLLIDSENQIQGYLFDEEGDLIPAPEGSYVVTTTIAGTRSE